MTSDDIYEQTNFRILIHTLCVKHVKLGQRTPWNIRFMPNRKHLTRHLQQFG